MVKEAETGLSRHTLRCAGNGLPNPDFPGVEKHRKETGPKDTDKTDLLTRQAQIPITIAVRWARFKSN